MRCFLFVFYIQSLARLFEYPVFVYNRLHYHAAVFYKIEKEGKKRRSAHGGGNFRDKECRAEKERKVPFLGQKKGEPARRTCRIIVKKERGISAPVIPQNGKPLFGCGMERGRKVFG